MEFEYDEIDRKHSHIMELLAVQCRSNKFGFKEGQTQRIDAIRNILKDSEYHEVLLPGVQIWRKDFSSPIDVLVSSHVDVVNSISSCSSSLSENGYYKGTYDNAGTNSAAVISMLEGDIPANVVFAFSSDEETGRCNGARQVLEYARNLGNDPVCIALDVTYEGYDDGCIFTVENLTSGHKKDEDKEFLNEVANAALALESDGARTCSFVKLHKNAIPEAFPKEYVSKETGWFDEAQAYAEEHAKTFSLCLPCEGSMHSNSGVKVRQPEFEGYVNALESVIYSLTNSHEQLIEAKRMENSTLHSKIAGMIEEEEEQRKANKSKYSYYSRYDYDDEEDYRAYNASFGIYDEDYDPSTYCYDPGMYPTFDDYLNSVIDDMCECAYGYEVNEVDIFVDDMSENAPRDIIEYFGGEDNFRNFVRNMFESEFMSEVDYEEEIDDLRYDEDGYEYDDSLVDAFRSPQEKVKQRINEIEKDCVVFNTKERDLLIKYAKVVGDTDMAIEKVNYLAKIIDKSPQIAEKEVNRIRDEIEEYLYEKTDGYLNSKEDMQDCYSNSVFDEFDDDDIEY